jgi:hypothetical protein
VGTSSPLSWTSSSELGEKSMKVEAPGVEQRKWTVASQVKVFSPVVRSRKTS